MEPQEFFDSLELTVTTSPPRPEAKDDWPCIRYDLTFVKDGRSVVTAYSLGIGHVDWSKMPRVSPSQGNCVAMEQMIGAKQRNPSGKFKNKQLEADAAAWLAKDQKVKPNPMEVLARICEEATTATESTFEQWAGDFGYDLDSRQAESVYRDCQKHYTGLIQLLGRDNMEKLCLIAQQL